MTRPFIIWDVDGTLIDSREIIQTAMARAFETIGLAPPDYEDTRHVVGLDLHTACAQLAPPDFDPAQIDALTEAYRAAFVARRSEPDFHEPAYPGALDLLRTLAEAGWVQGIATGKSRRGVGAIFEMHPIADVFETVWCADDGPGKPDPFMVTQAIKSVRASHRRTVLIGDSVHDMAMARAANVSPHGVNWGFGREVELEAAGAQTVHSSFGALSRSLEKLLDSDFK